MKTCRLITKYGLLPLAMLSIGMLAATEMQDGKKKQLLNNENEDIQLMAPDWFFSAPNSIYLNIDSDNNSTDAVLEIAKHRTGDTGGTSLFKVQEDGNVGIGTNSPANALHVTGGAGGYQNLADGVHLGEDAFGTMHIEIVDGGGQPPYIDFLESNTGDADARISLNSGLLEVASAGGIKLNAGQSDLQLGTGVTVKPDGKIGIGTDDPAPWTVAIEGTLIAQSSEPFAPTMMAVGPLNDNGTAVRGVVFSGMVFDAETLQASGQSFGMRSNCASPDGFDFFAAGAGTDYGTTSSRRWKRNIANIDYPLAKIAQLRGVYFDWDEDHGGHHDVGFIAEEIGEVLPEIVQYEENGTDAIGMDYSKMTPLLVEAVNALREQNESLRASNDALQDRLAQLEVAMERLLAREGN